MLKFGLQPTFSHHTEQGNFNGLRFDGQDEAEDLTVSFLGDIWSPRLSFAVFQFSGGWFGAIDAFSFQSRPKESSFLESSPVRRDFGHAARSIVRIFGHGSSVQLRCLVQRE